MVWIVVVLGRMMLDLISAEGWRGESLVCFLVTESSDVKAGVSR